MMKIYALAAATALLLASGAQAQDFDVEAGKKVFNKCRACHAVGENARNKVGPVLNGVVGREWGAVEGYRYSQGREGTLKAMADGKVWDYETLDAYLTDPKDVIPKGKMAFAGLRDEADRRNVISYIASFDSEGNQVDPEPVLKSAGYGM